MSRFSFSYVEFNIFYLNEVGRWFFKLNTDPMLGHSDEVQKHFGNITYALSLQAAEDWGILTSPPGPTPFRIELLTECDGSIQRIFDVTEPEDAEVC